jgi:hypothetical protein
LPFENQSVILLLFCVYKLFLNVRKMALFAFFNIIAILS